jgi:hypothetical protein
MTLAIVIIALLVLLVIVDGSEASGAHREQLPEAEASSSDEQVQPATGRACILNVTSFRRNAPEQRWQSRKPSRQKQIETANR